MGDISKIKVGSTWHTVKDAAARTQNAAHHTYYVKGTQIASTGSWTGNLPDVDALYEGLSIDYWLPFAGSGNATLELTLADGTETGAIPVYYVGSTRVTTQHPVNTVWRYIYQTVTISNVSYTGWWAVRAYDANTTYSVFAALGHVNGHFVADSAVYRYQLLFHRDPDLLTPLNNDSNVTGTTKTMLTDVTFDAFAEIFYYYSTTTVGAGVNIAANSCHYSRENVDLRYTFNCGTSLLTLNKDVYLKILLQSDGYSAKIADALPLTQTLPVTNDGIYYLYLGRAYSAYQISLYPHHPIYYHDGTSLRIYTDPRIAGGGSGGGTWGGITGDIANQTDLQTALDAKAAASHTHGGIEIRPDYIISSVDLTDGVSALDSGKLYFYYEA